MTDVDKETRKKLYDIWHGAVRRTCDARRKDYRHYGGRGIKMCEEWLKPANGKCQSYEGYLAFEQWALSHGWKAGMTLDRVNNNAGYSPFNCRWISKKAQAYNRSSNERLTYNGQTMTRKQWADQCGLPKYTITKRLSAGWTVERTLTTPSRPKGSSKA